MSAARDIPIVSDPTESPAVEPPRTEPAAVVWRQKHIVVLGLAIGSMVGAFQFVRTPLRYRSASLLVVRTDLPDITEGGPAPESPTYLAAQCRILRSAPVLSSVAALPEIQTTRTFASGESIDDRLRRDLSVESDPTDNVISVSFESEYPDEAARIVNTTVARYLAWVIARRKQAADRALRTLQEQKADCDRDLAQQAARIQAFRLAHPNVLLETADGTHPTVGTLTRLTDALTTARLATIDAKNRRDLLQADGGSAAGDGAAPLRDELFQLEDRLDAISRLMGPNSPDVLSLKSSIARLRGRIEEDRHLAGASAAVVADRQWRAAVATEEEIGRRVEEQRNLAAALAEDQAEYTALNERLHELSIAADAMEARIRQFSLNEAGRQPDITVLEPARAATAPDRSAGSRALSMFALLGALGGVVGAFARETLGPRIHPEASEIETATGLPVLGTIPLTTASSDRIGRLTALEPHVPFAEAFRLLRTTVHFGVDSEFRTILIASPNRRDGRSTIASNLAVALAQSGGRTILVEADFRHPGLRCASAAENVAGLCDVLAGTARLRDAIHAGEVDGLDLLPCGRTANSPAERLAGRRFAQVMEALAGRYDRIVLDAPDLHAGTDALILAASSDITLLVLDSRRMSRNRLREAREMLAAVGAQVPGIILNRVRRRRGNRLSAMRALCAASDARWGRRASLDVPQAAERNDHPPAADRISQVEEESA